MSLRYRIPQIPDIRPATELTIPAALRPPVVKEFRRGADLSRVVSGLLDLQHVILDAAVGAGKSTIFPAALAKATKSVVIHAVPNPLLASELHGYLNKKREQEGSVGPPLELLVDPTQDLPRTGVVHTGCATLVAWLFAHGAKFPADREVSLILDEAHESDAYTHVLRTLAINMGASRIVLMSATMTPGSSRSRETPGNVVHSTFPCSEEAQDWDIDDDTRPWCYKEITNSLLVFIDSRSQSRLLADRYRQRGFLVFRLEANMPQAEFSRAMAALKDRKAAMVVLLADYSFRSGFTFDVDRVIDTGLVSYADPRPGSVARRSRAMFRCESEQAAGRAGRIREGTVHYAYPDIELKRIICDLEAVEQEAAAYISRCLGFSPIGCLAGTVMSGSDLPGKTKFSSALNGIYPLTYYVVDSQGRQRSPSPVRQDSLSPITSPAESKRASVASSSGSETASVRSAPPQYEECEMPSPVKEETGLTDAAVELLEQGIDPDKVVWQSGAYYAVSGVTGEAIPAMDATFPRGLKSVVSLIGKHDGSRVKYLTDDARRYATKLVLGRYNELNVEIHAFVSAVNEVARVSGPDSLSTASRGALERAVEGITRSDMERRQMFFLLQDLTRKQYDVRIVAPPRAVFQARVERFVADLRVLFPDRSKAQMVEFSDGFLDSPTCIARGRERAKGGRRRRQSEMVLDTGLPSWTGYKSVTVNRETKVLEFDSSSTRSKPGGSRSGWRKALSGVVDDTR